MIDTLFFVLQIVGFLVLVGWAVIHDRIAAGARTAGPLAFKPSDTDIAERPRGRRRRSGLTSPPGEPNLKSRRR